MFLLPQYLQYVQGRSVVAAGLVLAPLGVGAAMAAATTHASSRLRAALVLPGGLVPLAASTAVHAARNGHRVAPLLMATG